MDSGDRITVEMRLAAIEEKLDLVLAHLGLDGDPGSDLYAPLTAATTAAGANGSAVWAPGSAIETDPQLAALIQAGKKIQAIKVYREATGAGLKDAKNAVEALERSMRGDGRRR
ncbi:ribosomal protein L7/L12 [Catenulispora sp. NF23]|uniref:Ribosomal protein L7/L12 n=1 Tax=Catenulispora pinistramenti TaxID=2705254 RepID=A0ABS5KQ04_9ACTN|nr:ribosomal protein L7/L12 [Catenulispora pinistramenti]MBS2535292.1 ribosomal protein L7/L12 [Catenulispora pinistramenti]MBS2548095.1 ribosomal protein L7/L12 [Catenulispora pinistramenti]